MSFKTKGSPMMPLLDICEKNKYPYYEALEVEDKDSFVVAAAKGSSSSSSIDIPFAHFIRSATSTSSNHSLSKSQRTHATATTGSFESSSTTANNNHRPAQQTVFQQLQTNPGSNSDYYYTSQQQPSLLLPPLSSCYQTAQQPLLTVTASRLLPNRKFPSSPFLIITRVMLMLPLLPVLLTNMATTLATTTARICPTMKKNDRRMNKRVFSCSSGEGKPAHVLTNTEFNTVKQPKLF
jgi:hypothetical protein